MIRTWHQHVAVVLLSISLLAAFPAAIGAASATPVAAVHLRITSSQTFAIPNAKIVSFSPDGRWVATATDSGLCIAAVRNLTARHCLTFTRSGVLGLDASNVRWSPDSSRLAFSEPSYISLVDGDIWVMEAASGKVTDLTPGPGHGPLKVIVGSATPLPGVNINVDTNPAWSADGQTIYFARTPVTDRFEGTFIMRVPAAGGTATQIATVDPQEPGLLFIGGIWPAADGTALYFTVVHARLTDRRNGIYRINRDGTQMQQLAGMQSDDLGFPILLALSPTGDVGLVLYAGARFQAAFAHTPFALMNLQSGALQPLVANGSTGNALKFGKAEAAAFSPDGRRLLYGWTASGEVLQQALIVRDLASGAEQVISAAGLNPVPPQLRTTGLVWAPGNIVVGATSPSSGFVLRLGP